MERSTSVQDGAASPASTRVEMIREVMSTRSSERPRIRNSQLSSRLMVASARPNTIAERSRTNRNSECGP